MDNYDPPKSEYGVRRVPTPPGISVQILDALGNPTGQRQLFRGREAPTNAHQMMKLQEFLLPMDGQRQNG